MAVVAKLFVSSVRRQVSAPDTVEITLNAVTQGDENRAWAEATPAAKFEMSIQNPDAAVEFELGQEFYVRFEKAERVKSLADPHDYVPSDYEQKNPDHARWGRCEVCKAKRQSHDEPLRSKLVKLAGLGS